MKTWTYSWIIYPLVYTLASIVALGNKKIRETLRLRSWKDFLSLRFNAGQPIEYWVHVASAGELEYAIPILQELGKRGKRVLVTYYSISAKKPVEDLPRTYPQVSLVVPLPHDGLGLMREFVALVRRQGVKQLLLLKYELWPGLLWECNAQGVKVFLVDALRPSWFHKRLLHKLDGILSGYSSEIESLAHANAHVVGDTRVERVLERVGNISGKLTQVMDSKLRNTLAERPVLVCGSMWKEDTKVLLEALEDLGQRREDFHIVWVPHELDENEGKRVAAAFQKLGYAVYGIEERDVLSGARLAVIVMKKGFLVELYGTGRAAFVGGGFGPGVHSVWEPALAGLPVSCGPRTERSPESRELANRNVLTRIQDSRQMSRWLTGIFGEQRSLSESRVDAGLPEIIGRHRGAACRIVEICERN